MNKRPHILRRIGGVALRVFGYFFTADSRDQLWCQMVPPKAKQPQQKPPVIVILTPPHNIPLMQKAGKN